MNRRQFLHATGAGLATMSVSHAADAPKPNVVMIVGDDQRWTDFGFMNHEVIETPRIDRLARESAVFTQGYVPTSLCRASLATLLTGMYPHQHRICCNDPPMGVDRTEMHPFIRNAPAIPRVLGRAGYRSLQTGKFWEGAFANAGFTHGETTDKDRHIARAGKVQIGRDTMQPIYDFIDGSGKNPFFVWYAPMMPHKPHTPPERLLKKYAVAGRDLNLAKYYAMVEWFDETVGQLLDHLDKAKQTENTLVVFCIDNGWIQPLVAENNNTPFGGDRGKRSPYDGGIRTPILLRWPNHTRAGRYPDLALTIDLAPTIFTAAGVALPKELKGLNLLNVAAGKGRLDRSAIFGEIYVHSATRLGRPDLDVTYRWVREGDWKLIFDVKDRTTELFQLVQDPHEKNDLAAKEANRVKQLMQTLDRWVADR